MWALVLMCGIVIIASGVQACLGMGYGLTAAPLLALVDPAFVPVATILVGMLTSSMGAWSERAGIDWSDVKLAVAGRLAGALAAAVVLSVITDKSAFLLVFGVGIAVAVMMSLLNHSIEKSSHSLTSMGAVSGLMGTITGVGAPPMALVFQGSYAGQARPTLAAIFAIGCFVSIVILALIGWLKAGDFVLCAMMLPPMFMGTYIGRRFRNLVDTRYRIAILLASGVAAAILIIRAFQG